MILDNKILGITTFSILIEGIIAYFNEFFVQGQIVWQMVLSIIFGIIFSVSYELDLLDYFGVKSKIKYIGFIITGILISRGSNYIWDLISNFTSFK